MTGRTLTEQRVHRAKSLLVVFAIGAVAPYLVDVLEVAFPSAWLAYPVVGAAVFGAGYGYEAWRG